VAILWAAAALWLAAAMTCFVFRRRPIALRLRVIGKGALVILVCRAALVPFGHALRPATDLPLLIVLPLAAALLIPREVWLVRTAAPDLLEKLREGCAGLFVQAGPVADGKLEITARGTAHTVFLASLGTGLTLAVLPTARGTGKVALLMNWLSNQYPGPFPRPRISLKRRKR